MIVHVSIINCTSLNPELKNSTFPSSFFLFLLTFSSSMPVRCEARTFPLTLSVKVVIKYKLNGEAGGGAGSSHTVNSERADGSSSEYEL